jgi:hypothetical protein
MHGGKRAGAGRKPKNQEQDELKLIDATISPAKWQELISKLFEKAIGGDVSAARLLFERKFGASRKSIEVAQAPPPPFWADGEWGEGWEPPND